MMKLNEIWIHIKKYLVHHCHCKDVLSMCNIILWKYFSKLLVIFKFLQTKLQNFKFILCTNKYMYICTPYDWKFWVALFTKIFNYLQKFPLWSILCLLGQSLSPVLKKLPIMLNSMPIMIITAIMPYFIYCFISLRIALLYLGYSLLCFQPGACRPQAGARLVS